MSSVNILADVFMSNESQKILKNKFTLFIGDSVIRSMYKDFVKLLQKNDHLTDRQLKNKGEFVFENDVLLEGGQKGTLSNDVTYTEVREFKSPFHLVRFYFITRSYSDYLKSICDDIRNESEKPDLVIMNSGCWDLTRYGINSIYEYKKNLPLGIYSLIKVLPCYTLFLWATTLPLSKDVKGGFMLPEVECHQSKLREDVLEANKYAANVMQEYRLDLIDLHYYFRNQIHRRAKDGIHWDATAHRRITNLILHHVCEAWELETPGRIIMKNEIVKTKNDVDNMNASFDDDIDVSHGSGIYTNFEENQDDNHYTAPKRKKMRNVYSSDNANFDNANNYPKNPPKKVFKINQNNHPSNNRKIEVYTYNNPSRGQPQMPQNNCANNSNASVFSNSILNNPFSMNHNNPFGNINLQNIDIGLTQNQSELLKQLQQTLTNNQYSNNQFNSNPYQNQFPLMSLQLDNQRNPDNFNRKRKFNDRR